MRIMSYTARIMEQTPIERIGTIEDIRFGMSGYQYTRIDGEEYLTLIDWKETPFAHVGATVRYRIEEIPHGWTRHYVAIIAPAQK